MEFKDKEKSMLSSLRGMSNNRLRLATKKVDSVISKVEVMDINGARDLYYAGAKVVSEIVGVKERDKKKKEPWWKKRIEISIKNLNRDLGRVNSLIKGNE